MLRFNICINKLLQETGMFFVLFVFSATVYAQPQIISASWTQISTNIPQDRFVPRELFKINDTTLYLGCRYYLIRVTKDSLKIELQEKEENVIRSVISFNDTLYVSNKKNSVLKKINDTAWVNILQNKTTKGNYNWEMTVYNNQLIYSSWPRWLEYYNLKTKTCTASSMLDQQGSGYIADFTTANEDLYVALYGGGVYKRDETTDSWLNCNAGLPLDLNVRGILPVNNKFLFAAAEDGVYRAKIKTAISWKPCRQTQVLNTKYVDLMYHNGILYATGINGELMVSKDKGKNWTRVIINGATGYVLYSIEAIGQDLYVSADGQGKKPSGVFTFPLDTIENTLK